jgi:hypothetical protein
MMVEQALIKAMDGFMEWYQREPIEPQDPSSNSSTFSQSRNSHPRLRVLDGSATSVLFDLEMERLVRRLAETIESMKEPTKKVIDTISLNLVPVIVGVTAVAVAWVLKGPILAAASVFAVVAGVGWFLSRLLPKW